MKSVLLGIACILLSGGTIAKDPVEKGNDFMEKLIHKMKNNRSAVYSLDPLYVSNIKSSSFETNDLSVKGLSRLYRVDNCSLLSSDGISSSIVCKMAADNLLVDFDYWAKAIIIWFNGEGTVKIDQLVVEMEFALKNDDVKMEKLSVVKLEDFHVEKINGLSVLFNWLLKYIAESVFNKAKDGIKDAVRETATHALRDVMEENRISSR